MKRSNVEDIFAEDTHRTKKILVFVFSIVLISLLALLFLVSYFKENKVEYVKYNETSDIDYKVYLKENNFFKEKYLGNDREYISTLIDYINATFKYSISIDKKDVQFEYTTKIEAVVEAYDSNGKKPIYKTVEEILPEKQETSNNRTKIDISENVKIDYNHYNDIIKELKKTYGLPNVESTLTINMYVVIKGDCDDLVENPNTESIISLKIPLTIKTVSIEMEKNLVENQDILMVCKKAGISIISLLIGCIFVFADICVFVAACIYIVKSRTARDIYQRELKRILSNYHSFIQKINNDFTLTGYQVLKVDTFTDMLEIRDTLGQPILMIESKEKNGVHFIIPSNTKILYLYSLKEKDIRASMKNDNN